MEITQKRGEALVFVGPQGSGKSALARNVALKTGGRVVEVAAHELESEARLSELLAGEAATFIVEGMPSTTELAETMKRLISNDQVMVSIKGQRSRKVKTPNFIFCTGDKDFFRGGKAERRYRAIYL